MDTSESILDLKFGLSQLSGNKTLLLTLLNKFSDEYRSLDDDLQAFMRNEQFDNAYSLIHTLKGVTGNLGLFALHQRSKAIESFVREEQTLPDDYNAFVALLNETLDAIATASNEDSAPTVTQTPVAQQARTQLLNALKASEFISQSTLDNWLDSIALPVDARAAVEDAIDELDYESALAKLEGNA